MTFFCPKISIIVPIYNAEKYLHRCVDSILAQTYDDFELLLINDGSKDNSGVICDEYATKDSRIRVFHNQNGGVSFARNCGLANAKGEWTIFVDSDDWIKPLYIEDFINNITNETKLVVCINGSGIGSSIDYINGMLYDRIPWTMMMKLYKTEVLKNTKALNVPRNLNIGEDLIANITVASNISEVSYINNDGYVYCENDSSTTKNRKWSLEYETKFLSFVKRIICDKEVYFAGYWLLCLRAVKNLLLNGVKIPRSHGLYKFVIENYQDQSLGIGDRIVLLCPYPQITKIILQLLRIF